MLVLVGGWLSRRVDPDVSVERLALADGTPVLKLMPRARPESSRGVVVLAHGAAASKESMLPLAEALAREGFTCLAFDFPGHGQSRQWLGDEPADAAFLRAARSVEPVELVVGHSMGAAVGARVLRERRLRTESLVVIGFGLRGVTQRHHRVLALVGRWDELVPSSAVVEAARLEDIEVVVSAWSDHVLEPFDRVLIETTVDFACREHGGRRHPPTTTWWLRLLGLVLLLLAVVPSLQVLVPSKEECSTGEAVLRGLALGTVTVGVMALGVSPAWVQLTPCSRTWPFLVLGVVMAGAMSVVASELARRARGPEQLATLRGHAAIALLGVLGVLGLIVIGRGFLALLGGLSLLVVGLAIGLGWLATRRLGQPATSHGVFAVLVGYPLGLIGSLVVGQLIA